MALTEAQLEEAKRELKRRDEAQAQMYHEQYMERQRAADARFKAKMDAAYPGVDEETRYAIYSDYRDYYE